MKRLFVFGMMFLAVLSLVWVEQAKAATITLTGTIRDFNDSHSDFEGAISGLVPGLVSSTLGVDGKPVHIGTPGAGAISSTTSFNQWLMMSSG